MGWLHVVDGGKGMLLRQISVFTIKEDFELPPKEILISILRRDNKNIDIIDGLSKIEILQYLSMDDYDYKDFIKKYEMITDDNLKNYIYTYLDEDYCEMLLTSSLSFLFCYKYDYPFDAFKSVKDYNGDDMIFCSYSYPPKVYHEKMSYLTEDILEKQLQEFMYELTNDEWYLTKKLEYCKEYRKD